MSVLKIKHTISKDISRKPDINHIKYQCFYENPAEQWSSTLSSWFNIIRGIGSKLLGAINMIGD